MTAMAEIAQASPTERKVAEMLLENTGSHFLDSGGAYGRAWQHARAKYGLNPSKNSTFSGGPLGPDPDPDEPTIEQIALVMRDEPRGTIDRYGMVVVDTFHWLVDRLEYKPDLDRKFQRWCEVTNYGKDRYDKDWGLPLMERFAEQLGGRGIYGEGAAMTINTYNGEDALDRTLQFTFFTTPDDRFLDESTYVLLQIHGGADVRGGYTQPVLFEVLGPDIMFDNDRMEVYCEGAKTIPGGTPGQLDVDGNEVQPIYHAHRWDNSYGDGRLRLTYNDGEDLSWYGPDKAEHVLVFLDDEDDEAVEQVAIRERWDAENRRSIPIEFATADNSRIELLTDSEDTVIGHRWPCPFDGSTLHVMGAIA